MNKLSLFLAFIIFTVSIFSCNNPEEKFSNPQQQEFDDFLIKNNELLKKVQNDIQKKEFETQFEQDLFKYIDSVRIFVNWKGKIKNITTKESGESTSVEFTIFYKPEGYNEIQFHCQHLVKDSDLKDDYIYNQVKNIDNFKTVYFDGFIRTKNNNQIYYVSTFDDRKISKPEYKFWITDIGTEERENKLPLALQEAVDFDYKRVEPLKLFYLKKITSKEQEKRIEELKPKYTANQEKLSESQKEYSQRVRTNLSYNFLFGE